MQQTSVDHRLPAVVRLSSTHNLPEQLDNHQLAYYTGLVIVIFKSQQH
jgi:hypothetical protein